MKNTKWKVKPIVKTSDKTRFKKQYRKSTLKGRTKQSSKSSKTNGVKAKSPVGKRSLEHDTRAPLVETLAEIEQNTRKSIEKEREENKRCLIDLMNQINAVTAMEAELADNSWHSTKTPLPNYDGDNLEFHDWQQEVVKCINANGWKNERRVLEMLPMALMGKANWVYRALTEEQKVSLKSVFSCLKDALDPRAEIRNRELFFNSVRENGEFMTAFVSRCHTYIIRSAGVTDVTEVPWVKPFMVDKIYANLGKLDRKILKLAMGEEDDINLLAMKADELLQVNSLRDTLMPQTVYDTHTRKGKGLRSHRTKYDQNYHARQSHGFNASTMTRPGGSTCNKQSVWDGQEEQYQSVDDEANLLNMETEQEYTQAYEEPRCEEIETGAGSENLF